MALFLDFLYRDKDVRKRQYFGRGICASFQAHAFLGVHDTFK